MPTMRSFAGRPLDIPDPERKDVVRTVKDVRQQDHARPDEWFVSSPRRGQDGVDCHRFQANKAKILSQAGSVCCQSCGCAYAGNRGLHASFRFMSEESHSFQSIPTKGRL